LLGRPVRLDIVPAGWIYAAGDPIPVRVTAASTRDVTVRAATAGLVAKIWYQPRAPGMRGMPGPPPATVTGATSSLSLPGMPAGGTLESEAVVRNWARAPSGMLGALGVGYRLRAELVLDDGGTVACEAPIRILSRRSLNQDVEGAPLAYRRYDAEAWRYDPVRYEGNWDLALRLSALHARPDETLRGVLRVSPHRAMRARRVLVSLHVVEALAGSAVPSVMSDGEYCRDVESPTTRGRRVRPVRLAAWTRVAGPRDYPFTIRLPADACPTIRTRYLAVRWYLRGWVQERSSQWQVCDTEINIFNDPH
jgi:hypothetical protein